LNPWSRIIGVSLAALTAVACAAGSASSGTTDTKWIAAWGTAMHEAMPLNASNFSCRSAERVSADGTQIRIRLTNQFVRTPTTFNRVTVAQRDTDSTIVPTTLHQVTFGGQSVVTIPAGGEVFSDPVPMPVTAGEQLAVSVYSAGSVTEYPNHELGLIGEYCTDFGGDAGDHTGDPGPYPGRGINVAWVSSIEVAGGHTTGAVIVLGDSVADGAHATVNTFSTWPDVLSRRLQAVGTPLSVVNEGVAGNTLITPGGIGPTGAQRFDRDVLGHNGARTVIIAEGSNDLYLGTDAATLIDGLKQLADRAHSAGLRVVGATVTPRRGGWFGNDDAKDANRVQVNEFIRTDNHFDAIIDFDAIMRNTDPNYPNSGAPGYQNWLNPLWDSGDRIHPNNNGYAVMANSIDLSTLN
jgi:lysophospholipase L1-like esterase